MKKTLLALFVLGIILVSSLAYAFSGRMHTDIRPNALTLDTSNYIPEKLASTPRFASTQDTASVITTDLWALADDFDISANDTFDQATNTWSFSGEGEHYLSGLKGSNYAWYPIQGAKYTLGATISCTESDSIENVTIYLTYYDFNTSNIKIAKGGTIELSAENGYTLTYNISADNIPTNTALYIFYVVNTVNSTAKFVSCNHKLTSSISGVIAVPYSSSMHKPGLGPDQSMTASGYDYYLCNSQNGNATFGFYDIYGKLYINGINTSDSIVSLPNAVVVNGVLKEIESFGYGGEFDWTGSPNLTRINLCSTKNISVNFKGSPVTDLFIDNSSFSSSSVKNASNIYLHIPYNISRSKFTGYKRVLVGEETPSYPIPQNSSWVISNGDGDYFGISPYNSTYAVTEIFSDKEHIILPVSTPYTGGNYYIRYFGSSSSNTPSLFASAPSLRSVTIPANYSNININWSKTALNSLHMAGAPITTYNSIPATMTVYVQNKEYYGEYISSSSWGNAIIESEGWEHQWLTVNVGRKGEFAQNYIELTDANWATTYYLKVTGNLNAADLANIKKVSNLIKLDLGEATFDELPSQFMESHKMITEVTLPDSLKTISDYAFRYCTKLRKVQASGIESIYGYSFYDCSKLQEFAMDNVKYIYVDAFTNCSLYQPIIPSKIQWIGSGAFAGTDIREANLPTTVSAIYSRTFSGCSKLSDVRIPEGLTSIESYAFQGCASLTNISLPSTLNSIGSGCFYSCTKLHTITCRAVVPPTASSNFTSGINFNQCTLYVAPFSIDAYREADNWKDFYIIKALNEPIDYILIQRPISIDLQSQDNEVLKNKPALTLSYDNNKGTVGQLTATGDGTLSSKLFLRDCFFYNRNNSQDYRSTLINNAENMRADSVSTTIGFEKNKWHFISFPYDVRYSDIRRYYETDFVIRSYNGAARAQGTGTSNWVNVHPDSVLHAYQGYIIQTANNNTYQSSGSTYYRQARLWFPSRNSVSKNNIFTNKDVEITLADYPAEFAHNRSWNLIGNPYPCYYNMHSLKDGFTAPIILWRGSSYQAYSPIDDDIILQPNESFFVQKPVNANKIVFGAEGRMHYTEAYASSGTPGVKAPALDRTDRHVFNFTVKGDNSDDRARVVINESASNEYESERDAVKFFAEESSLEMYIDGDVAYDICERPLGDGVARLAVNIPADGKYSISLDGRNIEGWSVILTDIATGQSCDLTAESYDFIAQAGPLKGRFNISFGTDISSLDSIEVNETIRVINLSGVTVFEGRRADFTDFPEGIYIVVANGIAHKIAVK